jgi:hypothetical protein
MEGVIREMQRWFRIFFPIIGVFVIFLFIAFALQASAGAAHFICPPLAPSHSMHR